MSSIIIPGHFVPDLEEYVDAQKTSSILTAEYYLPDLERLQAAVINFDFDDNLANTDISREKVKGDYRDYHEEKVRRLSGPLRKFNLLHLATFDEFYRFANFMDFLDPKYYDIRHSYIQSNIYWLKN